MDGVVAGWGAIFKTRERSIVVVLPVREMYHEAARYLLMPFNTAGGGRPAACRASSALLPRSGSYRHRSNC